MFKKGLALKQKKLQNTIVVSNIDSSINSIDSSKKKSTNIRSMTLSSVLLAQRFSSTLLAPMNKLNPLLSHPNVNNNDNNSTTKKTT